MCLKMDFLMPTTTRFWPEILFGAVAERSKASDHFRSIGQKLRWGPGNKNFFSKNIFYLSTFSIFTLFFKLCVTFLVLHVAIFLKMAPLFSFEPTVV